MFRGGEGGAGVLRDVAAGVLGLGYQEEIGDCVDEEVAKTAGSWMKLARLVASSG